MILSFQQLEEKTHQYFEEDVCFKEEDLKKIPLFSKFGFAKVKIKTRAFDKIFEVKIHLLCELFLLSSRNLAVTKVPMDEEETYLFTKDPGNVSEDIKLYVQDELDLYPYYLDLLLSSIPYQFVGEEKAYPSGDGWEVISEEDYKKRKNGNSAFQDLVLEEKQNEK